MYPTHLVQVMYGLLVFWMIYQALAILRASSFHRPSLRWGCGEHNIHRMMMGVTTG